MENEIIAGQKFLCTKDIVDPNGFIYYTKGYIYTSENYNCISDNYGSREHRWDIYYPEVMKKFKEHFRRIPRNKRWKNR